MKIIFVMLIIVATKGFNTKVEGDTRLFETADKCLRNIESVKEPLKKQYDEVYVECKEKPIITGK